MSPSRPLPPVREVVNDAQTSIRLPLDVLDRVDDVCERMRLADPDYRLMGLRRTDVIRMAIVRGLDSLTVDFPPKDAGK